MKYSVRPASEDDVEKVAAIEKKTIRPPWSAASFCSEIDKKFTHFWVLTDDETDEQVLGYAVFSMPAEQAHIQTFAVDPSGHRRGFGSHIMRKIIAFVIKQGGESIVLEVRKSNTAAIKLYQSVGFTVIHVAANAYPDGEDGFSMMYRVEQAKLSAANDDENESGHGKQNLN